MNSLIWLQWEEICLVLHQIGVYVCVCVCMCVCVMGHDMVVCGGWVLCLECVYEGG